MESKNKKPVYEEMYFPKQPNYKCVPEYFVSKMTSHMQDGKRECGDNIERNVEISNYLAQRQLEKTTKKLSDKRKFSEEKRKIVQAQWADLSIKEDSLRQNFIRFNQFVKENQEKKERAANKIVEQSLLKEERHKRTNDLILKCAETTKVKANMDKHISQYRIYEDFLNRVVENENSMQTINDLIKRYEALIGARKELNEIQQRDMMKLEKAKSNLKKLTDSYLHKIGSLNNKVIDLQERYDKARLNCQKWEKLQHFTKVEATEKVTDIVTIKESCKKMYLEVCGRKNVMPVHINNVEKQLMCVKQAISEFEIINRRVKEQEENELKASIEPKVSQNT